MGSAPSARPSGDSSESRASRTLEPRSASAALARERGASGCVSGRRSSLRQAARGAGPPAAAARLERQPPPPRDSPPAASRPVPAPHSPGYSPRGRAAIAAAPAEATATGPAWRGRGPDSGPRRPVLGTARTEGWTGAPQRQRGTGGGSADTELTGRRRHPHSQPYKCLVPRLLPVGAG